MKIKSRRLLYILNIFFQTFSKTDEEKIGSSLVKLIRLAGASFQEHIPYHNIENDRVGTDGTKTSISMEEEHICVCKVFIILCYLSKKCFH